MHFMEKLFYFIIITIIIFMNGFALLKLLKQYGTISKFDFLFHRSGPMKGQPRGYAFVTYKTLDSAKESLAKLQGKRIGQKTLSVKWAYAATKVTNGFVFSF